MTTSGNPEPLSSDEIGRYARHIVLSEIGGPGQQKLKAARVLVIGAGGSARRSFNISPQQASAQSASATTTPSRSHNLQRRSSTRQTASARRRRKAAAAVAALNSHVNVIRHDLRLSAENAPDILKGYD